MQETATDTLQLIRSAGAKLAAHWPTLIALTLAGFTVKLATLKLALLAGKIGWAAGVLVFAFTAAGLLAAIILMLRRMVPSGKWPHLPLVLAPFLVIFLATNHFDGYQVSPALERPVTMDISAASVLIAAVLLRWLLPLWKVVTDLSWAKWVWLALDICWMSLVAFTIASHPLSQWIAEKASPASWALSTVFTVLIVPLAWLAVGALALGARPADLPRVAQRAGLMLTLAACLIIVLVQMIPLLLWQIERLIIGPQSPETFWLPISGLLGAANSAVGVLLVVCLVGAFVARLGDEPHAAGLGDEPGVAGQYSPAHDPYSDGFGVSGRDEEDGHLIGI